MERGRGRYPYCFGGGARAWIGGKRSAPEEWMEEDDLLSKSELCEKVQKDQDQKRRFQMNLQGGSQISRSHEGFQDSGNTRPYSRLSGGTFRDFSSQAKGWG